MKSKTDLDKTIDRVITKLRGGVFARRKTTNWSGLDVMKKDGPYPIAASDVPITEETFIREWRLQKSALSLNKETGFVCEVDLDTAIWLQKFHK